jgi:phage-related protein
VHIKTLMKQVIWMGSSKEDLRAFPGEARREVGYQLGAFRCIYLATRPEGIYVLHCFQKKTQKTSQRDLDLAQRRFKSIQVKS